MSAIIDDHVLENRIKQLVESTNSKLSDVVNTLEEEYQHQFDYLHVEKNYVETVLKLWLEESRQNAYNYLQNIEIDIGIEMPNLLSQLDSIEFLKDVQQLDQNSRILSWCGGNSLQLIFDQSDIFETTRQTTNLVSSYLNRFKEACTHKIVSLCLKDEEQRLFIQSLNKFLGFVNTIVRRPMILTKYFLNNQLTNDRIKGKELIDKLLELCHKHFQEDKKHDGVEKLLKNSNQLTDEQWTLSLQTLVKEICKRLLLPSTTVEHKAEGGRRIIVVKGVSVFVSEAKDEMLRLKNEYEAQEVQIVGLSSVRVDCVLEQEKWHGVNISVVTGKLFIDNDACWDVSGNDNEVQLETADSGQQFDKDGKAGINLIMFYLKFGLY